MQEIINVVEKLNMEITEYLYTIEHDNNGVFWFDFSTDGFECAVSFLGHHVWGSVDDEREWLVCEPEEEEKEPMETFLMREANRLLWVIKGFKFQQAREAQNDKGRS